MLYINNFTVIVQIWLKEYSESFKNDSFIRRVWMGIFKSIHTGTVQKRFVNVQARGGSVPARNVNDTFRHGRVFYDVLVTWWNVAWPCLIDINEYCWKDKGFYGHVLARLFLRHCIHAYLLFRLGTCRTIFDHSDCGLGGLPNNT